VRGKSERENLILPDVISNKHRNKRYINNLGLSKRDGKGGAYIGQKGKVTGGKGKKAQIINAGRQRSFQKLIEGGGDRLDQRIREVGEVLREPRYCNGSSWDDTFNSPLGEWGGQGEERRDCEGKLG